VSYQYGDLKDEYAELLKTARVTRATEIERTADRLIKLIPRYRDVEAATGVPAVWLAAINERESSSNFRTYLGNGDPLNRVSVHVPAGRGPFSSWEAGAKDALHLDRMDTVKDMPEGWSWTRGCFQGEAWNGFGPRMHGIHTGYLWAGMTPYVRGKYVADGVWDRNHVDEQLGIIPMMRALVERDASLDLAGDPWSTDPLTNYVPPPAPKSQDDLDDVATLQRDLNKIMGTDLRVDGSYGRLTRGVVMDFQKKFGLQWIDGIVGNETKSAIQQQLGGH